MNKDPNERILIYEPPKIAGAWTIGGNWYCYTSKAPTKWQQFWTKRLLGWEWQSNDPK